MTSASFECRHCCDLDSKTRFLLALAGAVRAVQVTASDSPHSHEPPTEDKFSRSEDPALLRPQMAAQPHVLILAETLERWALSSFATKPHLGIPYSPVGLPRFLLYGGERSCTQRLNVCQNEVGQMSTAQVLKKWHDARLDGYAVVWQAAADFAVSHLKEETYATFSIPV